MTTEEFIDYVEERTYPFTFLENGRAQLSELFRKYPESLLQECVDIGIKQSLQQAPHNNGCTIIEIVFVTCIDLFAERLNIGGNTLKHLGRQYAPSFHNG